MVNFVAERARKQVASADVELFAVTVGRSDGNVLGTLGDAPATRDGKAALLLVLLARKADDFGIDELDGMSRLDLNNGDAAQHTYLRSGKTDTVGGVHGFQHIIQEGKNAGSDFIHGTADLAQGVISDFYNFSINPTKLFTKFYIDFYFQTCYTKYV